VLRGVPYVPMEAFIHGVHRIIMEVIVVDVIPKGVEIKVDTVLVVRINLVGVDVITGGVVEADSFEKVIGYGVAGYGVVIIDAAVHPVLSIIGDDIVLNQVVGPNDHHPIIRVFSNDVAVRDDASTAVFRFYSGVVVEVDLIVEDGRIVAVIIHKDA